VGISVLDASGRAHAFVGTGPLLWQLDAVEGRVDEGPINEVVAGNAYAVVVHDVAAEQRWPRYVRRARNLGVTAEIAVGIAREGHVEGVLSLYATEAVMLGGDVVQAADAFAELVATALAQVNSPR
jgi:GAF domain-containing protein